MTLFSFQLTLLREHRGAELVVSAATMHARTKSRFRLAWSVNPPYIEAPRPTI